jgi:DNA polymerase (family 10)
MTILGHPTNRLLNGRDPVALDMERLMEAARERGVIMEVNAQPERLDLDDAHCKLARDVGVRVAVSTDAHSVSELRFMRWGVGQARRGWLEPGHVVNTRPLDELRRLLRR